jgi:hypothetical protein
MVLVTTIIKALSSFVLFCGSEWGKSVVFVLCFLWGRLRVLIGSFMGSVIFSLNFWYSLISVW